MPKIALASLAFALPALLAAQTGSIQQPAPIARPGGTLQPEQQPAPGVFIRSDRRGGVTMLSSKAGTTEVRLNTGRADVILDHPEPDTEILVDLPGGQVSLLKDGFYTFNADTGTTRVLHGEAIAYTNPGDTHGAKIKEAQQLTLVAGQFHAREADRFELEADILPSRGPNGREDRRDDRRGDYAEGGYGYGGYGDGGFGGYGYGYGPYAGGFSGGYPYAGYGYYPYGGLYPYGYGYPFGLGIGFGYYGGFRGGYGGFGGFRGGFRR